MAVGDMRISSLIRAYALTKVGSVATRTRLYMANAAEFEPVIKDIAYEGDGDQLTVYRGTGFNGTYTFDSLPAGLLTAFNKAAVTTGLATNETDRVYWMSDGDAAGVVAGMEVILAMIDDTNNVSKYLGIVAPVGTLSTLTPPAAATSDKAQTKLQFSAKKTAVDIAGVALPGVPTGGAFWYYSVYSNAATFA